MPVAWNARPAPRRWARILVGLCGAGLALFMIHAESFRAFCNTVIRLVGHGA